MKVVFRPCCSNCGYEFQELHGIATKVGFSLETRFEPSHCPKCNEPVEGIVYFAEYNDGHIFRYSKLFSDQYTEGLKNET